MTFCPQCLSKLRNGHVPPCSLVCVDTGEVPHNINHLPPLTVLEEKLVAPLRATRHLMFCCPPNHHNPPNSIQKGLRGHVIAIPNPPVKDLAGIFPVEVDRISDVIQVVFLVQATKQQSLHDLAKQTKALSVSDDR